MNRKWTTILVAITLVMVFAVPSRMAGRKLTSGWHHHYKLIVLPTLGGANSTIGGESIFGTLNNQGDALVQGDTAIAGVSQVYSWQNGIQTEFQVLPAVPDSPPNSAYPNWVNQWGLGVGVSTTSAVDPLTNAPEGHAVLWTPNGKIIDLGTLGGYQSQANAVNDFGQVTGWVENTTPDPFSLGEGAETQGFIYQFGVMHLLGTLGGPDSNALFVDDLGQAAGCSWTSSTPNADTGVPTLDAFIWQNGKMTDLHPGNFGGTLACTNFMNNIGEIVGFMADASENNHPFLWKNGKTTDLFTEGNLGGDIGSAHAVNLLGHVAGDAWNSGFTSRHAVLWRNGGIVDLGLLSGAPCSDAYILNSGDQVVGTSGACDESSGDAFLWENGSLVDLNTLIPTDAGIQLQFAFAINESGEIAGDGILTASGDGRGFLLIPCDQYHPGIAGCDYSLVDAASVAEVRVPLAAQKSATLNHKPGVSADVKAWWRGSMRHRVGIEPLNH